MKRHRGLIVEDDAAIADVLSDVVAAIDCDAIRVDNKQDALRILETDAICFALLDLEIKLNPDSIRSNAEAGASLVREIRRLYPDRDGVYKLPVVVVSAHAPDVQAAVKVMRDGASDLIEKPFDSQELSERIRAAMRLSGRHDHTECPAKAPIKKNDNTITIDIPAERKKRRTIVLINQKPLELTDRLLVVLLHLVDGKLRNTQVHTQQLGAKGNVGHRGPSELRIELEKVLPAGVDIVGNDHNGRYWLTDEVEIGEVAVDRLASLEDHRITKLAQSIGSARSRKV